MKTVRFNDRDYMPASHENPAAPGVWKKVLLHRADLMEGRVQMINWARLPAGASFQAHYHEDMQEVFVIVSGQACIRIDQETADLNSGDTVVIPARSIHAMRATGRGDVEYIALGISPEGQGRTVVV